MIPNLGQLLLVCGIALAVVLVFLFIIMKLPKGDSDHSDKW